MKPADICTYINLQLTMRSIPNFGVVGSNCLLDLSALLSVNLH